MKNNNSLIKVIYGNDTETSVEILDKKKIKKLISELLKKRTIDEMEILYKEKVSRNY